MIVFRDVTDEQARAELNEQTLKALFDAIPVAISVADPQDLRARHRQSSVCGPRGLPLEEIVGAGPAVIPGRSPARPSRRRRATARSFDRIYRRPGRPAAPGQVSLHADQRRREGEAALILGRAEDISEERRVQQQLVQSGKLAAIGELAAGVAHEINNPLFAILGLTEFLLKEAEPESKAHSAARADPADGPRDQGDRPGAARLRPRKCRRTSRGADGRRGPHRRST